VPDAASVDDSQALTASCSEEERARCAEAGMADLMPKPIQLAKLQASAVKRCAVRCVLCGTLDSDASAARSQALLQRYIGGRRSFASLPRLHPDTYGLGF
jgi:CheY-like chemotaxis protein